MNIAAVSLVVRDYDEAISFYVNAMSFVLVEDTDMGNGKRWVAVAPRSHRGSNAPGAVKFILAKAGNDAQAAAIGNQTGGRVSFFLETDNFEFDYNYMKANGVKFCEEPRHEVYGDVVVFQDLYGNKFDLIQRK